MPPTLRWPLRPSRPRSSPCLHEFLFEVFGGQAEGDVHERAVVGLGVAAVEAAGGVDERRRAVWLFAC